jgi:exonuclease VII large subunit
MAVYDHREARRAVLYLTEALHGAVFEALETHRTQAKGLLQRITRFTETRLAHERQALLHREALLEKVSPYAAFARGFAWVRDADGAPVASPEALKVNDALTLRWANGSARVAVTQVNPNPYRKGTPHAQNR